MRKTGELNLIEAKEQYQEQGQQQIDPFSHLYLITAQIQMIPIKEHNDIISTLMKEIASKESEIKAITKDRQKGAPQVPQLQPTNTEQMLNKKINQLTKEHKERVNNLNQQLRSKSQENRELKERLAIKSNIESKQKEHIAQIVKKTYDRKPSSGTDYKISALISHYDAEIAKKNKFIQSLQKQIRTYEINSTKQSDPDAENENYKSGSENEEKIKGITLVEHQKDMAKLKAQIQKYRKLFEEKEKEYKDLSRRYSELTNQYYKVINSYGIQEPKKTNDKAFGKTQIRSEQTISRAKKTIQTKLKSNALQNLLQEMAVSDSEMESSQKSPSFNKKGALAQKESKTSLEEEEDDELLSPRGERPSPYLQKDLALAKREQIMSLFNLKDPQDIVPYLMKTKTKLDQYELADTISRSLQAFFYNIGKGKLSKKELIAALEDHEQSHNRNLQAVDHLDELCIEAGAKREKLHEKLAELIKIKEEYYGQLKNMKFMQQLNKGNKVIEFIEFFELDKDDLALPQQLINLQQQLKAIQKFTKEARLILEIDSQKSSQMVLELVLRYIEKTSTLVAQYDRKLNKPKPTPT